MLVKSVLACVKQLARYLRKQDTQNFINGVFHNSSGDCGFF
jgi:hypothetical protein